VDRGQLLQAIVPVGGQAAVEEQTLAERDLHRLSAGYPQELRLIAAGGRPTCRIDLTEQSGLAAPPTTSAASTAYM